jgi:uncharacterized hydrophobic protein (TIGR00271 family)
MAAATMNDLPHLREAVFFEDDERAQKLSRFWILLVLASIIASAGVVGDSTATVIGAMIVAPLMTPILGTMLAVVLGDRPNLLRSIGLVLAGAAAAILIGYLVGLLVVNDVVASNNSQVASRVNPRLIDLLAAVATGAVGSIALVRRDISDTLPGVAIAISLVPPLAVVGLTAEAGAMGQAAGALLLFGTNVAAILTTGIVVMAIYRVHRLVDPAPIAERTDVNRRNAVLVIVALFVVIGIPLTVSSLSIGRNTARESRVRTATAAWGDEVGWELIDVKTEDAKVTVRLIGPPPLPATTALRKRLEAEGVDPADVIAEFIPKATVDLADDDSG